MKVVEGAVAHSKALSRHSQRKICKAAHDSTDLTARAAPSIMVGLYGGDEEKKQRSFWESSPGNEFRSLV